MGRAWHGLPEVMGRRKAEDTDDGETEDSDGGEGSSGHYLYEGVVPTRLQRTTTTVAMGDWEGR